MYATLTQTEANRHRPASRVEQSELQLRSTTYEHAQLLLEDTVDTIGRAAHVISIADLKTAIKMMA